MSCAYIIFLGNRILPPNRLVTKLKVIAWQAKTWQTSDQAVNRTQVTDRSKASAFIRQGFLQVVAFQAQACHQILQLRIFSL
jgi:hypothetical protein